MKISFEQANELLSGVLGNVQVVANDADKDVDVNALSTEMETSMKAILKPSIENELKDTIEASLVGKSLGSLRAVAQRTFSIPRGDLDGLEIPEIVAKIKETLDSRFTQTDSERNSKYEETVRKYEQDIENMKLEHDKAIQTERDKYVLRDISGRCMSLLESIPRKGGDLQEQADLLRFKMQSQYETKYNEETKRIEFYKDGNLVLNDKQKPLTDEDFAKSWAEKAGILTNDTRHVVPSTVTKDTPAGVEPVSDMEDSLSAIANWAQG